MSLEVLVLNWARGPFRSHWLFHRFASTGGIRYFKRKCQSFIKCVVLLIFFSFSISLCFSIKWLSLTHVKVASTSVALATAVNLKPLFWQVFTQSCGSKSESDEAGHPSILVVGKGKQKEQVIVAAGSAVEMLSMKIYFQMFPLPRHHPLLFPQILKTRFSA